MTGQRRLLLVTTSLARGGAERQVVDLASSLRDRSWQVAVVSMTRPTDFVEDLAQVGVPVVSLDMARGRPTPRGFRRYISFVRRWRPDVIHSHMVHANLLARVGRFLAPSTPVVCTVHNVIEGPRWREIAYRLTDPLASATTAVSQAATERYLRVGAVPAGRIDTLRNGVNLERAAPPEGARARVRDELDVGEGFLWVTIGRLVPAKGHDLLLRAMDAVRRDHPDSHLAIAGEGPARTQLEQLRAQLGLERAVVLLGERRDVPSILAAADGFVLSSRWEGLPMVLLEAAAQGLAIVSTDVGGCREIARPELGAVLTEPSTGGLATGMLHLMGLDPTERAAIGLALQQTARAEFALDVIVDAWERLYLSLRA
jgi:glycosyltransferase involved in cell wall biosynthesis